MKSTNILLELGQRFFTERSWNIVMKFLILISAIFLAGFTSVPNINSEKKVSDGKITGVYLYPAAAKREVARSNVKSSDTGSTKIQTIDLTRYKEVQVYVSVTGTCDSFTLDLTTEVFANPTNAGYNFLTDCKSDTIASITTAKWFIIRGGNHTRFKITNLSFTNPRKGKDAPAVKIEVKGD